MEGVEGALRHQIRQIAEEDRQQGPMGKTHPRQRRLRHDADRPLDNNRGSNHAPTGRTRPMLEAFGGRP